MYIKNLVSQQSIKIIVGIIIGLLIAAVDNFAFGGEVSPIVIVLLLFISTSVFGGFMGRGGFFAAVFTWTCIPLVHLVKHVLNLPDTLHPNTYDSIFKLTIFTFIVASFGFGSGLLIKNSINKIKNNSQ